ncbi:pseudopodium-enriched atypical kinase 1-like [Acanthaster planci]|uniref:Pseudopodium-enriched atypical kinase 1-like n=1 Tax=Acanthaster planci TaxID=133434 RepID=A0A8B7ZNK5_ACAPL|nr:pseudopodium-enriched atypical kinase 1-like [Acanthaster planci]XP_022106478.1 pseudopodium-enriched atypical kinase 1-like [Acanthaster planci]XP_022106479.1 pseudopodium-enriched atypical kinase 1-like [Acanthaster planci]XP_022106480.1 pseudopodium-enriched atypical kinase 1-like [Acanthaster planci]XP_022106481.1 pseudopodium-enriched atypical kinase 1-like [Acanthaster planci]XP_022106482.1 pseudopodium-enriched atypical kinase 1-like [Acanthaster planci]XP_022106484.1 pseudopodium-e
MKEDNKPSNIACASFMPHRFKATQCGRCFKSHAQHKQFMKGNKTSHVHIMDIHTSQGTRSLDDSSDEDKHTHEKLWTMNGKNLLLGDESGEVTTDYYAPDSVTNMEDDADMRKRRQIPKKSAARRTREAGLRWSSRENGLKLNIPIDQMPLNDLSLASDVKKSTDECDSLSDSGSENCGDTELLRVRKNSGNGRNNESEKLQSARDQAGIQYLKALRASRKSAIPIPKTIRGSKSDSKMLQEFQEVARNLRHVENPNLDLNELNGNHCRAVSRSLSVSDSDTSPQFNRLDLEERQRTIEAKTSDELASTAFQIFSGQGKHGTLPRNLGSVDPRPAILNGSQHQRQASDPEIFLPLEKEEMQVVSISTSESSKCEDLTAKKQVVTSSKISSEIFFGTSSSCPRQRGPKLNEHSQEVIKTFLDHTEKPVMIVAADGSVSHYRGSAQTKTESSDPISPQKVTRLSPPKHLTKPYKVVDVSKKPPEHPPDFDIPAYPKLPLSPSPKYKSSDLNTSLDSGQDSSSSDIFQFKESTVKFPKREVALVDGMYAMKDSVQFSKQNVNAAENKDVKSPLSLADGEITPPLPILLSESESETSQKSDKRRHSNSSNYKVPIFISPKNYDNVGTVLSDRESSMTDLSQGTPGTSGEGNYGYLTPLRPIKEANQVEKETPPIPPVRTSSETQLHVHIPAAEERPAKPAIPIKHKSQPKKPRRFQEPNSNNSQSSPESRWRSKTHPLGEEPLYAKVNVQRKKSTSPVTRSSTDVGKAKQKRVAPQPPNGDNQEAIYVLPDTLPRGLAPLPPGKATQQPNEKDLSEASPGRVGKSPAPSPPNEALLESIYEAMDRKPNSVKAVLNESCISPSKLQQVTSSCKVQSSPKQCSPTTQHRAQSPEGRQPYTTKGKVQSPTLKRKSYSELKGAHSSPNAVDACMPQWSSLPRSMSPPIPCARLDIGQLPDSSPHPSPNNKETKSKRSKLPWRRRRKKDDRGSPEREFDATAVEKWLEGVHRLRLEDDAQRNSMDRMEVINAYKGELTAYIDHSDLQTPSLSTSPEQNGDDSDGSGIRMRASSSSKRRAPEPPTSNRPASWMGGTSDSPSGSTEDFLHLQKGLTMSPRSKRRASDGDTKVQYENTGILRQRQKRAAPPKPERRRRNMTTGFENLPSQRELEIKPPAIMRQSSSDPDFAKTVYDFLPGTQPVISAGTSPLKSALKAPGSFETKKAEGDAHSQPKRPVRIIAPQKSTDKEPSFVNIYSNIEIKQRGLGTSDGKTLATSVVFTADAETQCVWTGPVERQAESDKLTGNPSICRDILDINRMALAKLAVAAPAHDGIDQVEPTMTKLWEDFQLDDQPCCMVPDGAFYKVTHAEQVKSAPAVLISTDVSKAPVVLHIAQCIRAISTHPNVLNICHASIESVPHRLVKMAGNQSKVSPTEITDGKNEESTEAAVVMTDKAPVTHMRNYVSHKKEMHEYLPERYEQDITLLLLQMLKGLQHLQMHRVCLRSLKPDDLLLVDSGLPGGGLLLQINAIMSHLRREPEEGHPGDIYGSPEQLDEKIAEFDVGLLVYEFLHQTNPFAVKTSLITQEYEPSHLPPIPTRSRYSQGLSRLAGELLRKKSSDRLSASRAINMLQCLLWGPPADLLHRTSFPDQALQQWLATEQAKKVASMCQYCILSSNNNDTGYSITDQLQCQFLSDVSIQGLSESMKLLYH